MLFLYQFTILYNEYVIKLRQEWLYCIAVCFLYHYRFNGTFFKRIWRIFKVMFPRLKSVTVLLFILLLAIVILGEYEMIDTWQLLRELCVSVFKNKMCFLCAETLDYIVAYTTSTGAPVFGGLRTSGGLMEKWSTIAHYFPLYKFSRYTWNQKIITEGRPR